MCGQAKQKGDMTMIKVIKILPNGNALVATEGLFRILIQPEGAIAGELMDHQQAQTFVNAFNRCETRLRAEVTYASQIASN